MALTTAELSLIEQRVANDGPSTAIAYLFWLFLGIVSAHRFYLGRGGSAILQIMSYFILVGFIWLLIDGFLIPGMVRSKKDQIRRRVAAELGGNDTSSSDQASTDSAAYKLGRALSGKAKA